MTVTIEYTRILKIKVIQSQYDINILVSRYSFKTFSGRKNVEVQEFNSSARNTHVF